MCGEEEDEGRRSGGEEMEGEDEGGWRGSARSLRS